MIRILSLLTIITLMFPISGCSLAYIFHAATGQFRLLYHSIPVEEALKKDFLSPEQKNRLQLVAKIKAFGEKELGLKETENYQTVHLKSNRRPIYTVSASPKDHLTRMTWWFPFVGRMPYLGFFDLERARAKREALVKKDLDVTISKADAYSTLGWFKDPVTLNLIDGSTADLVETILHEMTHTTLYVKGEGEFNEGLAMLVGMVGAVLFLEKTYGQSDPLTIKAKNSLGDERIFSHFLASFLEELEQLYNSAISYQEKLAEREKIFSRFQGKFGLLKIQLKTHRFTGFGTALLNNAYIMSAGLYHRHFHLFEAVYNEKGDSISDTLLFFQKMTKRKERILKQTKDLLDEN